MLINVRSYLIAEFLQFIIRHLAEKIWNFATKSDFQIAISLQSNVVNVDISKLRILLDQII